MSSNGKKENILTSWKEIAAYLDRDVRTCVRWEQRYGLPVHRLERDSKAKVFAYKDQIDEWLAKRSAVEPARTERKGILRFLFRPLPLLLVLGVIAAAVYFLFIRPTGPADFHIRGSELIIVDGRGRELWPFDTRVNDLVSESEYRTHFQDKRQGDDYVPSWPFIMIRDINGDGRPEVLFSVQTKFEIGEGTLICLNDRGQELWRFQAGREFIIEGETFRKEYRIFGINVEDYDGDKTPEILVISFQKPDWPCQVILLDAAGNTKGEYWNSGYLMDASAGDVDGDGDKEFVVSGINNEYERGCVAVFEAGGLRGQSPQSKDGFKFPDIPEGGQSAYILFPTSDVAAAMHKRGDPINQCLISEGDGLNALATGTEIYYGLDRDLNCQNVTLSHMFMNLHANFLQEGKVRSVLDEDYKKNLKDSILYYENGTFVKRTPMPRVEMGRLDKKLENTK